MERQRISFVERKVIIRDQHTTFQRTNCEEMLRNTWGVAIKIASYYFPVNITPIATKCTKNCKKLFCVYGVENQKERYAALYI
jgi:hypothetical protein